MTMYVGRLKPRTREMIEMCSSEFAEIIERSFDLPNSAILTRVWYSPLKGFADVPSKNVEKVGRSGGNSATCCHHTVGSGVMQPPMDSKKARGVFPV